MIELLNRKEAFYLNKLKENFYTIKSMMKPLDLGYQKISMCPNFCMLYYLENIEPTECRSYGHSYSKPRTGKGRFMTEELINSP